MSSMTTTDNKAFLNELARLVGHSHLLTDPAKTARYRKGFRSGQGREPHSVIGSSCIGASVIGGICNNSGGSLVQRGPAYTEMSLFARINEDGKLTLVNHLGIDLGETPEQILSKLDDDRIKDDDVRHDGRHAHDYDYVHRVRDIEADTPARYNADPDRLFESSGCAGKLAVFAVRLDTFEAEKISRCFISAPTSRKC